MKRMSTRSRTTLILALVGALVVVAPLALAPPIANPGFELGPEGGQPNGWTTEVFDDVVIVVTTEDDTDFDVYAIEGIPPVVPPGDDNNGDPPLMLRMGTPEISRARDSNQPCCGNAVSQPFTAVSSERRFFVRLFSAEFRPANDLFTAELVGVDSASGITVSDVAPDGPFAGCPVGPSCTVDLDAGRNGTSGIRNGARSPSLA